ncbi:hypothetical protein [Brevundimonas aurantiaca]|jgi:hypothetical protein|uniref:Uncharacterized protein n=1 Tax=Brevundimonas aurantiaca TaxID=74316 RepID=A0A7W9C966_9CAUL|nr:hypothetical protein [Brevundimonas aurantiaca]MBB5741375.1 hypothetical protein [Brevundimonas aurantiaca]
MDATAGGWGEDGDGDWGAEGMAEPGAERAWDDEPLNDRPLYDGRRVRDPYQRGGGYSRISEDRWDAIQRAYAAGEPGASVCRRFGLARSTLYARARDEGWLRQDQDQTEPLDHGFEAGEADAPVDLEAETAAGLCDYGLLAGHARVRMQRAILAGRGVEAGRWMRLHAQLTAMAQAEEAAKAEAEAQTLSPPSAEAAPAPKPPAPKRRSGPKPLSDCDRFEVLERQMKALTDLERSFAGLDLSNPVYRRLLEKAVKAVVLMGPDPVDPAPDTSDQPDTSDTSDSVFSTPVPS